MNTDGRRTIRGLVSSLDETTGKLDAIALEEAEKLVNCNPKLSNADAIRRNMDRLSKAKLYLRMSIEQLNKIADMEGSHSQDRT